MAWEALTHRFGDSVASGTANALRLLASTSKQTSSMVREERSRNPSDRLLAPAIRFLSTLAAVQVLAGLAAMIWAPPSSNPVPRAYVALVALAFSVAGAVLERASLRDPRALSLAGFFLCIASAPAQSLLVDGGSLTAPIGALLPEVFLPFLLWRFVRDFPRVVRLDPWAWVVSLGVVVSAFSGSFLFLVNFGARCFPGSPLTSATHFLQREPATLYWILVAGPCVPAPILAWLRSKYAPRDEAVKVRRFLLGLAAGTVPFFAEVVLEAVFPAFFRFMNQAHMRRSGGALFFGLLLTIPLTTTLAVLRPGLLSSPRTAQRGALYVFGRRAPMALVLSCAVLLGGIALGHPDESLRSSMNHPAVPWLLATGAATLLAMRLSRSRAARSASAAGRLGMNRQTLARTIVNLGNEIRRCRTRQDLASTLKRQAGELMRASEAEVFFFDPVEDRYATLDESVRPLSGQSALGCLVAVSSEPVALSPEDPSSVLSLLPEEERLWVADADVDTILPLFDSRSECRGLLVFGPRPNEERYAAADVDMLSAIASAAAFALEHLGGAPVPEGGGSSAVDSPAGQCRHCGAVWPANRGSCENCDGSLNDAVIPFILAGKFRLTRVLGQGGMGIVYAAEDLALERTVALKTLPHLSANALLRLRGEARSMARVVHPHLALIYGAETWRGVPVLVVEYMPGGTLAALLEAGPLAIERVVELGSCIAAALASMHDQGLVHRDVKPSNIAYTADGTPKLLDFGLAHLVGENRPTMSSTPHLVPSSRITASDMIVGTPAYLPPEAVSEEISPNRDLDLWALHVCLWESLTGLDPGARRPGPFPDPREARPDCPAELGALVSAGLALDPQGRPRSAATVCLALKRVSALLADARRAG